MQPAATPPPLQQHPRFGHYPWWPEDGDAWLHPEDVELARRTIPSPRVWRRDGRHGEFEVLPYGDLRLRVRPTLWREVEDEGYAIGDWVEVLPRGLTHEPVTGQIREMHWDPHHGALRYQLDVAGAHRETFYAATDLKHVAPPAPRVEVRVEPPADLDAASADLEASPPE